MAADNPSDSKPGEPLQLPGPPPQTNQLETATSAKAASVLQKPLPGLRGVKSVAPATAAATSISQPTNKLGPWPHGHAEVIPKSPTTPTKSNLKIPLKVFWQTHDPTTPNQQGHDVGTQYRSAVFYHNEDQHKVAEQSKNNSTSRARSSRQSSPRSPLKNFFPAENYHQDYFNLNPSQQYCQFVIRPKSKTRKTSKSSSNPSDAK